MLDLLRKLNLEDKNVKKNNGSQNSLAFNQSFIAYTNGETIINLLEYNEKFNKAISLQGGHYNQIKYLKFSNNNKNLLLCSSSIDYVICWNINKILSSKIHLESDHSNFYPILFKLV